MNPISSISPVDGRYYDKVAVLSEYFSEKALFRYRVRVEVEYFIELCDTPLPQLRTFPDEKIAVLRGYYENFTDEDALHIKEIEQKTNHDIKAVEYFIKEKMEQDNLGKYKEFIHFALTSQDINNTAIPLSVKEAYYEVYLPLLRSFMRELNKKAIEWRKITILAHTHGQPASPTTLGKEMQVFVKRLDEQLKLLSRVPFSAKFGGATGNFNAHKAAYPNNMWPMFAGYFTEIILGLHHSYPTTQIDHYDHLAAFLDGMKRLHTILIDFSRDIWMYVSMHYFTQEVKRDEVGSSAMPHKVNPIDFENAEGNLGLANALASHISGKLPVSRLQRDLTDSTVLRNIGLPFAYGIIALKSLIKGLDKISPDLKTIHADLENNWAVVAEGIQNILRREGYPEPYEALKSLTRGNQSVTRELIEEFINSLDVSDEIKKELRAITPFNYTGYASDEDIYKVPWF